MDELTPDEIDQCVERMKSAAQIYKGLYNSEMKASLSKTKWAKRLVRACNAFGGPPAKYSGLLVSLDIIWDLCRFYDVYLNTIPDDEAINNKIKQIVGDRLLPEGIKDLCLSPSQVSKRLDDRTGGSFSAALWATGKVWGASGKSIQMKLNEEGLPSTVTELRKFLKKDD